MSILLADVRLRWQRALSLIRRGLTSVRTRGWRPTLDRVRRQFQRVPRAASVDLYLPAHAPFAPFALRTSSAPVASVVIPVFNQATHTLACLRALAEHPPELACEIILVDDGSGDETQSWIQQIQGLRYHRRPRNGGFIAACNDGAALASGRFIVFLNNDTVPQPGWLDALVGTFQQETGAGLVGAQLLYPDGRLQEAGGVVFGDGSAWNYGRFESPGDPRFASLREADYCSGAALAVPRELFAALGGFDTQFSPAYYEDTDLAFAVRMRGRKVLYQPRSRVVHLEGVTAGTDVSGGTKAYQATNRILFEEKWRAALAGQLPPSCVPTPALLHARQPQVLIVDTHTPEPDRDSASLRLFNLMKLLRQEGAHVVFVEYDLHHRGRHTDALRAMGVEVWCKPHVSSLPKWLARQGARFGTVMLCRYHLALQLTPEVRRHAPQAQVLFDTVDLHYVREARRAELDSDPRLVRAAATTRRSELAAIAASDVTLVVSEAERERLAADAPGRRVELLSNLHETGGKGAPFSERKDLVFVGGFRHPPNVDAVRWFVAEIMPKVRRSLP
ncbi:MAG TPA: glycosyltransferase family 2 protein, partial [Pseudoxanthomonas sp.]|nr:glycosyltransferase family 2 protein [Pseudoxanthomonas sp.]